jgi:hypothetical protein
MVLPINISGGVYDRDALCRFESEETLHGDMQQLETPLSLLETTTVGYDDFVEEESVTVYRHRYASSSPSASAEEAHALGAGSLSSSRSSTSIDPPAQAEQALSLDDWAGWGEALTEGHEEIFAEQAALMDFTALHEACEVMVPSVYAPPPARGRLPALLTARLGLQKKNGIPAKTFGEEASLIARGIGEQATQLAKRAQPHLEAFAVSAKGASCMAAELALVRAKEAQPHLEAMATSALKASRSVAFGAVTGLKAHCEQALQSMRDHDTGSESEDADSDSDSDDAEDAPAAAQGGAQPLTQSPPPVALVRAAPVLNSVAAAPVGWSPIAGRQVAVPMPVHAMPVGHVRVSPVPIRRSF